MIDKQNYLVKALVLNKEVRVYVLNNTKTVNEAIERHDLWPSAASVLAKALSMGQIMGASLKQEQALTIKINGKGPIGNVVVDSYSNAWARGYVDNPHISFVGEGGLADSYALGDDGFLDVIKDLKLKDLFTSSIALSGDLAYDFAHFFLESEQIHSAVLFGVKIDTDNSCLVSGGILFQLLPNASEDSIVFLENILSKYKDVSNLFINNDNEEILERFFNKDCKIIETLNVRFDCPCSKDHFTRGLISLGKEELEEIYNQEDKIEIVCHYCNNKYNYSKEEIKNIIKEMNYVKSK